MRNSTCFFEPISAELNIINISLTDTFKHRFNINNNILKWLTLYLIDRKERSKINNSISDLFKIQLRVPQESCMYSLAFFCYIRFLYDILYNALFHYRVFATLISFE